METAALALLGISIVSIIAGIIGICVGSLSDWITWAFGVFAVSAVLAVCMVFISTSQKPTFTLIKEEWVCNRSHNETTTTMIMSGKVLVPIISTHSVCDNYSRR